MKRAYRFRFYPTAEQAEQLARTFGCVRVAWNHCLQWRTDRWYTEQTRTSYNQCSAELTRLKKTEDHDWMQEPSSVPLQQALRHQQAAFGRFYDKTARYPRFKSRRGRQSAEYTRSAFRWDPDAHELTLAKMSEALPVRWSRRIPAGCVPSTVTVSLDPAGRYHVSILVEDHTIRPLPPTDSVVGVDLGITSLVALSTGLKIGNPRHHARDQARLAKAQRALARKEKGSANRAKARRRVARIHARIADRRRDHTHKLTTRLVRENQTIAVEDLNVKGMVTNRSLAKAISDAGWGELVRQLEYKAEWYARDLVKIDRWYPSSKRCSACGHVVDRLPLNIRTWVCPGCGVRHDRDVNAAVNVRAAGLAVLACGDGRRPDRAKARVAPADEAGNPGERSPGIPRL